MPPQSRGPSAVGAGAPRLVRSLLLLALLLGVVGASAASGAVWADDHDDVRVIVQPRRLDVREGEGTAEYSVVLSRRPAGLVTVTAWPEDGQLTLEDASDGGSLTLWFSRFSWNEARKITVRALDDDVAEGKHQGTIRHRVVWYGGKVDDAADVRVDIADNDAAGLDVSADRITLGGPGEVAELAVRLQSAPRAPVTVPIRPLDAWVAVAPSTVTLDGENWRDGAAVSVRVAEGADVTDGEATTLRIGPTDSDDPQYERRGPVHVSVSVEGRRRVLRLTLPMLYLRWPPVPAAPTLQWIGEAGLGDYLLRWEAVAGADAYSLQEALEGGFSAGQEIHAGPEQEVAITGRGPGRLYYRARALNAWGASPWSETLAVDVLWEREPNDAALTEANGPLTPGLTYLGRADGPGDAQDYYVLELSGPATVEVWLRDLPAGHNADLVLRDDTLGLSAYSGEPGAAEDHILSGPLPAGRYYVQVFHRMYGGSSAPYALEVQVY